MAFETGTATNHLDLWEKFHTFLTTNAELVASGEAWDVPWEVTPSAGITERVYRSRGSGIGHDVLVGVRTRVTGNDDTNRMSIVGLVALMPAAVSLSEHVNVSAQVSAYAQNSPMRYWITASGRRFILTYKISTTYHTVYGGLFLPYSNPVVYPYPLFVGATFGDGPEANIPASWRSTSAGFSNYATPVGATGISSVMVRSSATFLGRDGVWREVGGPTMGTALAMMGPRQMGSGGFRNWMFGRDYDYVSGYIGYDDTLSLFGELLGGGYAMRSLRITMQTSLSADTALVIEVIGDLDGVYYVDGVGNASENIVTVNGDEHVVIQNIFRTSVQSYIAMRLT